GERADSYGGQGANLTHEVRSALQAEGNGKTIVLSRIFGLGGKDFYDEDAELFFRTALEAAEKGFAEKPFDYHRVTPGKADTKQATIIEPLHGDAFKTGLITVTENEETGKLNVRIPPLRQLTVKPKRFTAGHGACPGCGIFPGLELF